MRGILVALAVAGAVAIPSCTRPRPAAVIVAEAPPAPRPATTGAPVAAWFGAWNEDTAKFERRLRFDRIEGETFGWRLRIPCTGPVRFKEVLRMPTPGDWSFDADDMPGTTIDAARTTATTIDYAACKQGWIEHVWSVTAGDPAGTYVITVEVDGYAPQTFRPRFVEP